MKAWVAIAIAAGTTIVALFVDPAIFFGFATVELKIYFAVVLASAAGLAFFLGQSTLEINLSRQISVWASGLAALAVVATNMDILTGTSTLPTVKPATEVNNPYIATPGRAGNSDSAKIYVPDTPKIERIERVVTPESAGLSLFTKSENRVTVPNLYSQKNTRLRQDQKLSGEQKRQFKKYLESQGLKYDPKTAFNPPGIPAIPPHREANSKTGEGEASTRLKQGLN